MTIHEKDALILRDYIGEAKGSKTTYELATTMAGAMLVKSKKTGRTFDIGWQKVIEMAVAAGIDKEPTP